ncbi:thioesterase II family protein [Paenibacillus sp. QZ-Y1]|uniref:thioesterase II family protein n=1 Tax=Paenibacillus sp. QZ-Y1 TaxID=3414511 RepID=UPI003F7A237F
MEQIHLEKLNSGAGSGQMVCFPYLGGSSSSFRGLAGYLTGLEVWAFNPPGHGVDTQAPVEDMQRMSELCCQRLLEIVRPGCILFGHSLGGIVAYFVALKLYREQPELARTMRLVLSACNTPGECKNNNYHQWTDDALIEHLFSYDGLPNDLREEKDLLRYFLPVIRADFKLLESSASMDNSPLPMSTLYLWGENDRSVSLQSALRWTTYLEKPMQMITVRDGNHMFVLHQPLLVAHHLDRFMTPNETMTN